MSARVWRWRRTKPPEFVTVPYILPLREDGSADWGRVEFLPAVAAKRVQVARSHRGQSWRRRHPLPADRPFHIVRIDKVASHG